MQLERIAVRLRRRTPWEALDLGHAMLRAWAGPAYRAWLGTYWVVGLLLLAIFWSHQAIALFILWWLKPAFDRVLLFAFSRSLFRTPTACRDVVTAVPELVRHSGLLSGLTLRRLSLARSFLLPVWQLEEQRGKAARDRCKVLSRRVRGNAVWLTFVCANLDLVLWVSLVLVINALTPLGAADLFSFADWFRDDLAPGQEFLGSLLVLLAESLVEPLYVAGGFALYLHRRSELEGWDIELSFRRLAGRAAPASPARAALGLIAAVALATGLALAPAATEAAETLPQPEASQAKVAIDAVLADPVFGQKTEETEWRWREEPETAPDKLPDWLRILLRLLEFSSQVLKGLAWIGALLLAAGFIYLIVLYHERWLGGGRSRPPPPDFLFGLDLRPESLPADIAAAARAALAAGHVEAALSLLYRGALVALIHRTRVEFRPGDTEADCRQRLAGHLEPAATGYFGDLLDAWRATAYAHRPPALPELEGLCRGWERHFGPAPGGPRA